MESKKINIHTLGSFLIYIDTSTILDLMSWTNDRKRNIASVPIIPYQIASDRAIPIR